MQAKGRLASAVNRLLVPSREQDMNDQDKIANFELSQLLHPAQAFAHPSDVVNDPDLTLNEKRAILASWASDACAIEAVPTLRCLPGAKRPVHFDEVMDALRALDEEARRTRGVAGKHRLPERSRKSRRG